MVARKELPISIVKEYAEDYESLDSLGKKYGVQGRTIMRFIVDHGGSIRKRGEGQQMYRKRIKANS